MGKKTTISPEDRDLFRKTVKTQRPKDKDSGGQAGSQQGTTQGPRLTQRFISASSSMAVGPNDPLSYTTTGPQQKTLRKLRQGTMPIEARLDLHNLTIEEAAQALERFLQQSQQHQRRTVIIIHGKGQRTGSQLPILKNQVNIWLREWPEVLAFCSAQAKDGGAGALYVLLKKAS